MSKIDALTKTLYGKETEKVAVIHAAFEEVPNVIGGFDSRTVAFVKTNTITEAWWRNEGVEYIAPEKTCRSTSVGDMVLIGKDKYVCKNDGWETLDGEVVR